MEIVAFIGGSIALVTLGAKAYVCLSDRVSRIEILQRLLLRKNGYDDDELERAISIKIDNHKKGGKGK